MTAQPQEPKNNLFKTEHGMTKEQQSTPTSKPSVSFDQISEWLCEDIMGLLEGMFHERNPREFDATPPIEKMGEFALFLGERAAIHEYDGKLQRHEAELMAIHDALGHYFTKSLLKIVQRQVKANWGVKPEPLA